MKFKNNILTKGDFNGTINGKNAVYNCWENKITYCKDNLTEVENVVCISSYSKPDDFLITFTSINFLKDHQAFIKTKFKDSTAFLHFIPVKNEDEADKIIADIKSNPRFI